jgi:CDP-diacylglycerol--serine O-phosphatidyltransferase
MVSTHTYYSFKELPDFKMKRFQVLVGFLLLFVLVAAEPQIMLFALFLIYLASGPGYAFAKKLKSTKKATSPMKKHKP